MVIGKGYFSIRDQSPERKDKKVYLGKQIVEKLWDYKVAHVKDVAGNQTSNCQESTNRPDAILKRQHGQLARCEIDIGKINPE